MTRSGYAIWACRMKNECLRPSDLEEITWPPLREDQVQCGLTVNSDMRSPAALDDDIQAYASCVDSMIKSIRRLEGGE